MLSFLHSLNCNVWILIILELTERIAYYGTSFTLATYSTVMLELSIGKMNLIINLLYVISPLAAFFSGGLSDGGASRRWVLLAGALIYALGLCGVAISAMPFLFINFPSGVTPESVSVFVIGIILLGCGYGTMKVCLGPLIADCALELLRKKNTYLGLKSVQDKDELHEEDLPEMEYKIDPKEDISRESDSEEKSLNQKKKSSLYFDKIDVHFSNNKLKVRDGNIENNLSSDEVTNIVKGDELCMGPFSPCTVPSVPTITHYGTEDGKERSLDIQLDNQEEKAKKTCFEHANHCCNSACCREKIPMSFEQKDNFLNETGDIISQLFRLDYFVINFGSIIGIAGAPFLRGADKRVKVINEKGTTTEVNSGYYIPFLVCAGCTFIGSMIYLTRVRHYPKNVSSRPYLFITAICQSVVGMFRVLTSHKSFQSNITETSECHCRENGVPLMTDLRRSSSGYKLLMFKDFKEVLRNKREKWEGPTFLLYGLLNRFEYSWCNRHTKDVSLTNVEEVKKVMDGGEGRVPDGLESSAGLIGEDFSLKDRNGLHQSFKKSGKKEDAVAESNPNAAKREVMLSENELTELAITLRVAAALTALPVYWLLAQQFGTNVIMQALWMEMPGEDKLPPEVFNNVNTLTILVAIPIIDRIFQKVYGKGRRAPVIGRVVAGFFLMFLSMFACTILQIIISGKGTFGDDDSYILNKGAKPISALWLIIPYVIQGVAATLVDTTVLEAVYTASPPTMKSTVMSLYLLASSASGFLGIIFSPFISAKNMLNIMIILCVLQIVVIWLFLAMTHGWVYALCFKFFRCSKSSDRIGVGKPNDDSEIPAIERVYLVIQKNSTKNV